MRIAVFTKSTTYHKGHGGLETLNKVLCEGLAKKGHQVVVFSPNKGQNLTNLAESGVSYVFIPCSYRYLFSSINKNSWFNQSYKSFVAYSAKSKFDIVLGQSSAAVGIIARKEILNIPIISIAHGTTLGELKTQLVNAHSARDVLNLVKNAQYVLRQFFGRQRDFILKSSHVIAVSEAVKHNLIEETFVSDENVTVINNGINPESFTPVKEGRPLNGRGVLFVGQLTKDKGVDLLVNFFCEADFADLVLYIVGDGPLIEKLRAQVVAHNASSKVKLLGKIPYKDVVNYYINPDMLLFAFPTRREEGLPMVLVEAMFAGLPVVAFDKGGVTDVVSDGVTGYVISPRAVQTYREKLLALATNPEKLHQFSAESLKKAYASFSVDAMIEKYEMVFRKVTNQ